jgi:exonuclease SbcD
MVRLSQAGIPTLLLVGNHDLSPASGRAHAMQEYETIPVPHIRVISRPCLLGPDQLEDLPLQLIGLPWVSRSSMMATLEMSGVNPAEVFTELETRLTDLVRLWMDELDPALPVVLTAHASVQGAQYGAERSVMLGSDLVLPGSLVKDPRLSYVALGHIHKPQDLNRNAQPPVIYPGSIERVDFGEVEDEKFFVIADVNPGRPTQVEWRKLDGRRFIDRSVRLQSADGILDCLLAALPPQADLEGAIVRLVIEYPVEWETMLNEPEVRRYAEPCFEFHLVRRPQREARLRLPSNSTISSLTAMDLLDVYWRSLNTGADESVELQKLAKEVIAGSNGGGGSSA